MNTENQRKDYFITDGSKDEKGYARVWGRRTRSMASDRPYVSIQTATRNVARMNRDSSRKESEIRKNGKEITFPRFYVAYWNNGELKPVEIPRSSESKDLGISKRSESAIIREATQKCSQSTNPLEIEAFITEAINEAKQNTWNEFPELLKKLGVTGATVHPVSRGKCADEILRRFNELEAKLCDAIPADVYLIIKKQRDADEANLKAHAQRLADALAKIAEREWDGEEKTWRTEAIEMQDEAREALAQYNEGK